MSIFEKHPALALATGALCLASLTASGLVALQASGLPMFFAQEQAPAVAGPASPVAISAVLTDSPASISLTGLLAEPPGKWKPEGPVERGAALPVPYACDIGAAPSVALSRSFRVRGERVQVLAAAYTAGLGAEAMDKLADNAADCAGASIAVRSEELDGPGVQTHRAYTAKNGHGTMQVLTFRRGDVLAFVVGKAAAPLEKLAKQLDKNLAAALADVCAEQESKAGDAARSPWSTAGYKPFTVTRTVSIRAVPLPKAPADADYETVSFPAPDLKVKPANPAAVPDYPVWPPMPDAREFPRPPKSPADEPARSAKVHLLTEDAAGPGCGWEFTGMSPVPFDARDAAAANRERVQAAESRLAAGARKWQQSVLDYWAAYDQYRTDVKQYKDYAAAVAKVNKAWDKIAAQWNNYWTEYAVYQQALAERSAFFSQRDNARAGYRNALAQCEADNRNAEQEYKNARQEYKKALEDYRKAVEEAEEHQGNEDEEEQPEPPTPPREPSRPEPADCDAISAPAILDWAPPAKPVAPAPPPDPRPVGQR